MARALRTIMQSILAPVLSTSLYFIVFGAAIGTKISTIDNVSYGAFIVPGLIMLSIMTTSVNFAAFGIYLPKYNGSIFEIMSKIFVDFYIKHPLLMLFLLILISITFSLFGFIVGIWATNFEKLQLIPLLIITPLVFLGGSFYSVEMLPELWQFVTKFNPIFYVINGFRWSFFGTADIAITTSLSFIITFLFICLIIIGLIFKTGYRIKG